MLSRSLIGVPLVLVLLAAACGVHATGPSTTGSPARSAPAKPGETGGAGDLDVTVIQNGLLIPWDIAFTPDGRMVVTEREGRIRIYASAHADAELLNTVLIPNVLRLGEGGGLGIAVDREFAKFPYAYVCATRDPDGVEGKAPAINELLRFRFGDDNSLTLDGPPLITGMRANKNHNGCAVEMDATNHIWLTVGDANTARTVNLAQQRDRLNGKVLRINRDGSVPKDNPVLPGDAAPTVVYTMGHRNPQGIAIRSSDGLVMTAEHGTDRDDEVNHIVPGGNYGYACYTGDGVQGPALEQAGPAKDLCKPASSYLPPAWASGFPTHATSGAVFLEGKQWGDWDGHLVVSTLKEMDLRLFEIVNGGEEARQQAVLLDGTFGRLRAVVIGPDGALYVSTSNNADDKILRVVRRGG
jgi:glucose/arabinose dehydrogenase